MIRSTVLLPAVLGLLLLQAPAVPAAGEGFVSGFPDLPLMRGLAPVEGQEVLFDKPGGRILQAVASGPVEPGRIRAFYAETLPQLGWRPAGADRFARDGEILAIEYLGREYPEGRPAEPEPATVRFVLNPQ
jgi:hypothetical protein